MLPRGPRSFVFAATVLFGAALFWLVPRPPMGDLPQHAAQVVMLRELWTGTCRWSDLVRINYFTPYLLGFTVAALLSFVMPVVVALKVALTAGYFGFVSAGVALRKEFGADGRLDWLLLPGYFGFAFHYGFLTFLVAAPLGLLFLLAGRRYAMAPTPWRAAAMIAAGLGLLCAHGLVFLFSVAVSLCIAAVKVDRRRLVSAVAPYAVLGVVAIAFFVNARVHDPALAQGPAPINFEWDKLGGWHRILAFPDYVVTSTLHDYRLLPIVLLMAAAPFALGDRPSRELWVWVPFAVVVGLWLIVPGEAARTNYLYHRFALFLLPTYALLFRDAGSTPKGRTMAVEAGLAALCWLFFGAVALRERRFARESASFEDVLAAAEPNERAMSVVLDPTSAAWPHPWAYHTYAVWYQVDRGGFVDFNFAAMLPEMVRFRPGRTPKIEAAVQDFDWHRDDASIYRYFFVHHTAPVPVGLFDNDQCRVQLVRESGSWSLYERRECSD